MLRNAEAECRVLQGAVEAEKARAEAKEQDVEDAKSEKIKMQTEVQNLNSRVNAKVSEIKDRSKKARQLSRVLAFCYCRESEPRETTCDPAGNRKHPRGGSK